MTNETFKDVVEKVKTQLRESSDIHSLEALGRGISLEDLQALSTLATSSPDTQDKLLAVLAGVPHHRFVELLEKADEVLLQDLIALAPTEPLQYHLTILSHSLHSQALDGEALIEDIMADIATFDTLQLSQDNVYAIERKIEAAAGKLQQLTHLCKKTLTIAWNTSRLDLIESFSHIKERIEILLNRSFDKHDHPERHSSSLYEALEQHLFRVYGSGELFEELKDETPAREALTRLAIWYHKDYVELGLFPSNTPLSDTEKSQTPQQASESLSAIGLKTLLDLKKARIFSKRCLREYILNHSLKKA